MRVHRGGLLALAGLLAGAAAHAQGLVPLGDEVGDPLLPAGVCRDDVEMFGELVYLWAEDDGANVAHFVGDFELQLGRRRLRAREAVIWMTPRKTEGVSYVHFEILLWRDAKVVEPAGTVTRGPAVFVTLNSAGKVRTSADRKSTESSAATPVYARAVRVRTAVAERTAQTETSEMTVIDLAGRVERARTEVEPAISYQGDNLSVEEIDGRRVVTVMGHAYFFRSAGDGRDEVEIRADAAVIYLSADEGEQPAEDTEGEAPADDRPGRARPGERSTRDSAVATGEGIGLETGGRVEGVYLEGDIVLTSGDRLVRASRLYYDFDHDRALILDAVVRLFAPDRDLPIYVRAAMVRQLSAREFTAKDALVTTSEFFTPHYHIGAKEVTVVDRREVNPIVPAQPGNLAGTVTMKHTTFNIGGVPLFYWPFIKSDVDTTETSLRSIRTGYSDNFGFELESKWELFDVLGLAKPDGVDGSLLLDYYTERGPAIGANIDYETDNSFGLYRGYYINDDGKDELAGRFRDEQPDTTSRGRTTWRHREYLPDDWQLTFELSYISDKNFLEEYFQNEHFNGKDQESLIYLKKQVDNWAFTAHLQYQLMDFERTTERLPDLSFRLTGEPIGEFGTFFSENRAGFVRLRPADLGFIRNLQLGESQEDSGTVARAEAREEAEFPLSLGDLRVVPFGSIRGGAWDDTPAGGGEGRVFGTYGLRSSMYAWRVYPDAESDLFDIHGIRHIIKADVVAWAAHTNLDSHELYAFDENTEGIDEVDGVSFGLRQRWQTKRGAPGAQRTVDLLTFDVELGFFNDAESDEYTNGYTSFTRPENSVSQNYLNTSLIYRINDSTEMISEMNYDLNDGEIDTFALTFGVERTPRLSYMFGYRYIGESTQAGLGRRNGGESNLLAAGLNYRISEKYFLAVREEFDLDRGQTAEFDIGVIRKFPRWYVGVNVELDKVDDDFGISLSAWPEGLPNAAIGSRRYTGLVTSTGIRPGS